MLLWPQDARVCKSVGLFVLLMRSCFEFLPRDWILRCIQSCLLLPLLFATDRSWGTHTHTHACLLFFFFFKFYLLFLMLPILGESKFFTARENVFLVDRKWNHHLLGIGSKYSQSLTVAHLQPTVYYFVLHFQPLFLMS